MITAGVIAGLLLLVHAHTFMTVMGLGGCLALVFFKQKWREWSIFFAIAILLAVPQMLWVISGSSVEAQSFIGWHFGWDKAEDANFVVFWLKNTGLFIPLLVGALLWRGKDYLIGRKWLYFISHSPSALWAKSDQACALALGQYQSSLLLVCRSSLPIVASCLARLWQANGI